MPVILVLPESNFLRTFLPNRAKHDLCQGTWPPPAPALAPTALPPHLDGSGPAPSPPAGFCSQGSAIQSGPGAEGFGLGRAGVGWTVRGAGLADRCGHPHSSEGTANQGKRRPTQEPRWRTPPPPCGLVEAVGDPQADTELAALDPGVPALLHWPLHPRRGGSLPISQGLSPKTGLPRRGRASPCV